MIIPVLIVFFVAFYFIRLRREAAAVAAAAAAKNTPAKTLGNVNPERRTVQPGSQTLRETVPGNVIVPATSNLPDTDAPVVRATPTRMALRNHEVQVGRAINPVEALANQELRLDLSHRMVLEDWLKRTFQALDAIAPHLLPTAKGLEIQAKQQKPAAEAAAAPRRRGRSVNLANLD